MTSEEEESYPEVSKKRRLQRPRACDNCRRRKVRCDGGQPAHPGQCSNCVSAELECTYNSASSRRNTSRAYVEALEERLESMEKYLLEILPGVDLSPKFGGYFDRETQTFNAQSPKGATPSQVSHPDAPMGDPIEGNSAFARTIFTRVIRQIDSEPPANIDDLVEDTAQLAISRRMEPLTVKDQDKDRWFGKSSGTILIQAALDTKEEFVEAHFNTSAPLSATFLKNKRMEYWAPRPWEVFMRPPQQELAYTFPDEDLMHSLIDLYFSESNPYLPLLHRPTFDKAVAEALHLRDDSFAVNLLLVCAIGARYSNDSRVLLDGHVDWRSSGWKWFQQVQLIRHNLLDTPSLYDIQFYCLAVLYLSTTSNPQVLWILIGIAIRQAQEVGTHRKKMRTNQTPVEKELWKRAWWVLVSMEKQVSAAMGRPCAIHDEDSDVELPADCDDEYWEHPDPTQAFKQPQGKPSTIACFIAYVKLQKILMLALRTIYSINRSKILMGFIGVEWEQHLISELDSALNKWLDGVPSHLRWDPHQSDPLFFNQAVFLYGHYYHTQILVHRPFIPKPRQPHRLPFPSLIICTNAARACANMVDTQRRRGLGPMSFSHFPVFNCGVVLLLSMWASKRSSMFSTSEGYRVDVQKCMDYHRAHEDRWALAGRFWDILTELASVSDLFTHNDRPSEEDQRTPAPPLQTSIERPFHLNDTVVLPRLDPSKLAPMPESRSSLIPVARSEDGTVMEGFSGKITPSHDQVYPSPPSFGSNFAPLDGSTQRVDGLFHEDVPLNMFQSHSMISNPPVDSNFLETATLDMWSSAPTSMVLNDWANYLNDVNELTHRQVQQPDHNDNRPWDADYMASIS